MMIPVVKLGTLALRTISKPIATKLKQAAGLHPRFREFIVNVAQFAMRLLDNTFNHRFSTTIQRRIYGRATDVAIRPLNEERAIQGIAIIYEVQRNSRSEARKEERHKQEIEALKQNQDKLQKEVDLLKLKVQEMSYFTEGDAVTIS